MNDLGEAHKGKRGLIVDEYMRVQGADGIWALGDCTQTPCKVSCLSLWRYRLRVVRQTHRPPRPLLSKVNI